MLAISNILLALTKQHDITYYCFRSIVWEAISETVNYLALKSYKNSLMNIKLCHVAYADTFNGLGDSLVCVDYISRIDGF